LTLEGKIDEIAISAVNTPALRLNATLDSSSNSISVALASSPGAAMMRGQVNSLVRIDDEILGILGDVSQMMRGGSVRVVRGVFGTLPENHSSESKVYMLPYPVAAPFSGNISQQDDAIPIQMGRQGEVPRIGYIGVWNDGGFGGLLPYRGGRQLRRFHDVYGQPVFNSAFGAPPVTRTEDSIGVFLPFRYYDLYQKQVYSTEGVFFHAYKKLPNSFIKRITWDATVPQGCVLKVQVRLNEQPSWESQPDNTAGKRGGLFEFTDPEGENEINLNADMVEIRVYFTYFDGAYNAGLWKDTPVLRSITLEYLKQSVVRSFEVLPK
ncbi:MAG: hypothetical protein N2234_05690, partial [Planctomycetota bacterium]|nr:hypothetical protein [Planctomycetota bacterium]